MTKRGADNYLTDRNWEEEEEPEDAGTFAVASEAALGQRRILTAKRRCPSSGQSSGGVFAGFTGLTGQSADQTASSTLERQEPAEPQTEAQEQTKAEGQSEEQSANSTTADDGQTEAPVPLSELFRKSSDTWECSECLVNNKSSDTVCVACSSARPSSVQTSEDQRPVAVDLSKPSLSELFRKQDGEWECKECFVRNKADQLKCAACEAARPAATDGTGNEAATQAVSSTAASTTKPIFSFGTGGLGGFSFATATSSSAGSMTVSGFSFGTSGFKFGSGAATSTSTSSTTTSGFSFGSSGTPGFNFGFGAASTTSSVATGATSAPSFSFTNATSSVTATGFSFGLGMAGSAFTSTAPAFGVTGKSFGGSSTFGATGFSAGPGMTFGSSVTPTNASSGTGDGEEQYEPPQAESVEHTEDDAFYTVKCKLFYMKENAWRERGVGRLFLKPCDKKTQLLVRTDTATGNILLNIRLTSNIPISRQGKNNVSLVCAVNPPFESTGATADSKTDAASSPVCMLVRVKTSELADELFQKLNESKTTADD